MNLAVWAPWMVIASGAIHAVINAVMKAGRDQMSSRALIDGFSALIILPAAFFVPLPHGAWFWLIASLPIHFVYLLLLVRSFESGDMSAAYPIARGAAPGLAALCAVLVFGEPISLSIAAGIACLSAGVLIIGFGRGVRRRTLLWSLSTGAFIAVYTVIDAEGVRAAPTALSYVVWSFITIGGVVGAAFAAWRGAVFRHSLRTGWRTGLAAGALAILTYGLALTAFRWGATPKLAALRETSILFGTAVAVLYLRETLTIARAVGVCGVAAGAMILLSS